ncbi:MAG: serine protease [Opitutales bacterium]|nr:serine protease [Opitutales bacterium]MCH8540225.1 S1C family serine protease [Opitutales bacterium]
MPQFGLTPGRVIPAIIYLVFLTSLPLSQAVGSEDFLSVQRRVVQISEDYGSAVVRVNASFGNHDDEDDEEAALRVGSGFFVSGDGHILTNASVAYGADRVWYEHEGISYAAEILGNDPETNLSLLRALRLPEDFATVTLSSFNREPPVGTMVVGITQPLDLKPGPVLGVLSGNDGQFGQRIFPTYYHRVSIPAYPGEGGSPVFSLDGRLVGMIVASLPEIRSSYLLPVEALMRVRDQLAADGNVSYSWIGLDLEEFSTRHEGTKVRVTEVIPGGPGHRIALEKGDVIKEIDGYQIRALGDVRRAIFFNSVGSFVEIVIQRGDETLEMTLRTAERPAIEIPEREILPEGTGALEEERLLEESVSEEEEADTPGGADVEDSEAEAEEEPSLQ